MMYERRSGDKRGSAAVEELQCEGVQAVGEAGGIEEITKGCVVPQEELGQRANGITSGGGSDGGWGDGLEDVVRAVPEVVGPGVGVGTPSILT